MARTRSESAHRKVLDAALELVAERGVNDTSMEAVARLSGVSKATIYKHWADKDALLLEMMADFQGLNARPDFDSGHTRADMIAVLSYRPPQNAELRERMTPHLMAYSASHPDFANAWRKMVMDPPRRELTHLLRQGIRKGELSPRLDTEVSLALLLGPLIYWHVYIGKRSDDPKRLVKKIVEAYWKAFGMK